MRDAVARAGGFRLGDGFISPLDLVEIGLAPAEDVRGASRRRDRQQPAAEPHPGGIDVCIPQSRPPYLWRVARRR